MIIILIMIMMMVTMMMTMMMTMTTTTTTTTICSQHACSFEAGYRRRNYGGLTKKPLFFSAMFALYTTSSCGPKLEACGTPHCRLTGDHCPDVTQKRLSLVNRKDLNQSNEQHSNQNRFLSTSSKTSWSIVSTAALRWSRVSKAAERSRNQRQDIGIW